jgi:T5SS/PEP-CTERM-associated repeat protein
MQRGLSGLLISRAGFFFSFPAISSLRAVDFGPGVNNRRIKSPRKAGIVVTCLMALNMVLAGVVFAQTNVWAPTLPTGNWFNPSNWTSGVPTATQTVIINTDSIVTNVQGAGFANTLTVGSGVGPGILNVFTSGTNVGSVTVTNNILIGNNNSVGTLNITAGGTVSSGAQVIIGNGIFSQSLPGTGTVLVSGQGSTLNAPIVVVAQYGIGTLTVQEGAVVNAPTGIFVGTIGFYEEVPPKSAQGVVDIGAPPGDPPVAPGILNTPAVSLKNGLGTGVAGIGGILNFNHDSTDYIFAPSITGAMVNGAPEPGFANIGVVNVYNGTTILTGTMSSTSPTGANTYGGGTNITGGVLAAGIPEGSNQAISNALGVGDVSVSGGALTTPCYLYSVGILPSQYNKPLTINVGGNYTQGPGGTLALGISGLDGSQYDHVNVAGLQV